MSNVQKHTECPVDYKWQRSLRDWLKVVLALAGIVGGCTIFSGQAITAAPADEASEVTPAEIEENKERSPAADTFQQAQVLATQAVTTAQTAATAPQWDTVIAQWLTAIAMLQTIPPESPSRIMAQRQIRGYLQQLQDAQRRAEQSSSSLGLASLGSDLFNEQLAGYLSYVNTVGTPDVLIVGSSRALQGIDPHELQQALAVRGHADLNVYNFSVNGATAQVVEFVVGNLLTDPLPPVVVWGDGSRAFNEGRRDYTWESLRSSPGYRSAQAMPGVLAFSPLTEQPMPLTRRITADSPLSELPGNLDVLGFSAVSDRFDPQTYYQQIPQVEGRYDGAYAGFALNGAQADALGRLATKMQSKNVQLMFVNLPLSGSYLDNFRLYYEQQFQRFLQTQSSQYGFAVVDLLTQWENQPGFFADPSHINQEGARVIARQLAQQLVLTKAFESVRSPDSPPSNPSSSEPSAESPTPNRRFDLPRPTPIDPIQDAPVRRPPPPIPSPPSSSPLN